MTPIWHIYILTGDEINISPSWLLRGCLSSSAPACLLYPVELDNVRVLNSSSLSSLSSSSAKFPAITPQPKYSIKLPSQSIYRQLSRGLSCWTGDEIELLAKGQPDRIPSHPRPQHTSPSDATTLSRWWFADRWWWWGEQCLIVLSGAGESLHPTA